MKKRFVALLLCLVMVVGLIPAAMAAGSEADRNYITFKANDGSYGSSSERLQQLTESDVAFGKVTLRANDFTRDGYTFLGWPPTPTARRSITTARLFPYPNCLPDAPTLFCTLFGRRTM